MQKLKEKGKEILPLTFNRSNFCDKADDPHIMSLRFIEYCFQKHLIKYLS